MVQKSNKKVKKADLSITLILIIGILIVVNYIAANFFARIDLTENKVYSISQASKNTVAGLDDIVTIKAYFSSTLPTQLISLRQEVADILDEYRAYSNGKIRVEFIDPQEDEGLQQELMMLGIPQLTFEVYEKDKMQLVNGYMGIAVSFGGQTEVIPAVRRNTSDLEYQLTTAIKKVISEEIATIGFLTGNDTLAMDNIQQARQELEELYTVREVSWGEEDIAVPEDIDTLVIVGPKSEFSDDELRAINSFLERGGALLALVDGVSIEQGLMAQKNNTGLPALFDKYGLKLNQDLVADVRNSVASFTQGFMTFSSNYAYWPKVTKDGFNQDNSTVANLENLVLPWASSVSVDEDKVSPENFEYLAYTTDKGWHISENFNVLPQGAGQPQGEQKRYNLAVTLDAEVDNAYPETEEGGSRMNARLSVVGDSDFVTDGFLQRNPDNLNFFLNLVDSLSFDDDLIQIRSKGVSSRPIDDSVSDQTKAAIKYFNIFGLTVVVIAFGLVRYYLRRRSRFVDEL